MGCGPHRGRRVVARIRPRLRRAGAERALLRVLRLRLPGRSARGATGRGVHRGHPTASDPVRHRSRRVLRDAQRRDPGHEGHPDQLRLSADRTLPADVLHVGGSAPDRRRTLVLRHLDPAGNTCRRGHAVRGRADLGEVVGIPGRYSRRRALRPGRAASPFGGAAPDPLVESSRSASRPGSTPRAGRQACGQSIPVPACASTGYRDHRSRRGRRSSPQTPSPPQRTASGRRTASPSPRGVGQRSACCAARRAPHLEGAHRASRAGPSRPEPRSRPPRPSRESGPGASATADPLRRLVRSRRTGRLVRSRPA